jgi:hypothetical protein
MPNGWWCLPMDPGQVAPGDGLNIIYDDRPRLLDRVSRLVIGFELADGSSEIIARAMFGRGVSG